MGLRRDRNGPRSQPEVPPGIRTRGDPPGPVPGPGGSKHRGGKDTVCCCHLVGGILSFFLAFSAWKLLLPGVLLLAAYSASCLTRVGMKGYGGGDLCRVTKLRGW